METTEIGKDEGKSYTELEGGAKKKNRGEVIIRKDLAITSRTVHHAKI